MLKRRKDKKQIVVKTNVKKNNKTKFVDPKQQVIFELLKNDYVNFLNTLMEVKNISKQELANKMNVDISYVRKVLKGRNITIQTYAKFLSGLDFTIRDFELILKRKLVKENSDA